MSSQNRIGDYRIFEAPLWSAPSHHPHEVYHDSEGKGWQLQFLVKREPFLVGLGRSFTVLCSRANVRNQHPIYFFRDRRVPQFKLRSRSFMGSVLVHGSLILLLTHLPHWASTQDFVPAEEKPQEEVIYFRVPLVEPIPAPRVSKPAPSPALAEHADSPPAEQAAPKPESTASYGNLTIVSKPSKPDNFHQTIIQPLSAPDVKIMNDVKAPNIVVMLGKSPDVPKPTFALNPSDARPTQVNRQAAAVEAPTLPTSQSNPTLPVQAQRTVQPDLAIPTATLSTPVAKRNSDSSQVAAPTLAASQLNPAVRLLVHRPIQPELTIPAAAPSAPVANRNNGGRQVAAPTLTASQPNPALLGLVQRPAQPDLAIPAAMPSAPVTKRSNSGTQVAPPSDPILASGASNYALVVIGVNPADPSTEVALPPGNRSGEFEISPASNGAAASSGSGGGASMLSASEHGGESGDRAAAAGTLSISGPGTAGKSQGVLGPALGASVIFPVPADFLSKIRKNQLVVSTGPMGGGGLNLYGAMQCGRIYTVFLQMPNQEWTLEYCEQKAASNQPVTEAPSNVTQLETPLTPPDAQSRFDFQRVPLPPDKLHKMIVLKGVIREDGTVDQVKVYQGLMPQMDEAARLALSQWKFKPALRQGKPVPLNILVGIPATLAAP